MHMTAASRSGKQSYDLPNTGPGASKKKKDSWPPLGVGGRVPVRRCLFWWRTVWAWNGRERGPFHFVEYYSLSLRKPPFWQRELPEKGNLHPLLSLNGLSNRHLQAQENIQVGRQRWIDIFTAVHQETWHKLFGLSLSFSNLHKLVKACASLYKPKKFMSGFLMYGHDPLLDPIEKLVKEIGMRRMRYALLIENVRAEIGDHRTAD